MNDHFGDHHLTQNTSQYLQQNSEVETAAALQRSAGFSCRATITNSLPRCNVQFTKVVSCGKGRALLPDKIKGTAVFVRIGSSNTSCNTAIHCSPHCLTIFNLDSVLVLMQKQHSCFKTLLIKIRYIRQQFMNRILG